MAKPTHKQVQKSAETTDILAQITRNHKKDFRTTQPNTILYRKRPRVVRTGTTELRGTEKPPPSHQMTPSSYSYRISPLHAQNQIIVLHGTEPPPPEATAYENSSRPARKPRVSDNFGIMDYYRMKNIQADTEMRETISKE